VQYSKVTRRKVAMSARIKLTTTQYDAFLILPENAHRRFELIQGEIMEKIPTQLHAYIRQMLSGFLFVFLRQNPLGYALIEARYRVPGSSDVDLIPDLSFVAKGHGPLVQSGPVPYLPELVIEAQSEGQSDRFILDKALLYLANGTRMVWVIYSTRQIIEVLTPTERYLLTINDTLTGFDVLPGFSVAVREIFPSEADL
jgi:Uma2 family endonuclease